MSNVCHFQIFFRGRLKSRLPKDEKLLLRGKIKGLCKSAVPQIYNGLYLIVSKT